MSPTSAPSRHTEGASCPWGLSRTPCVDHDPGVCPFGELVRQVPHRHVSVLRRARRSASVWPSGIRHAVHPFAACRLAAWAEPVESILVVYGGVVRVISGASVPHAIVVSWRKSSRVW